jgi:hypothetical protein
LLGSARVVEVDNLNISAGYAVHFVHSGGNAFSMNNIESHDSNEIVDEVPRRSDLSRISILIVFASTISMLVTPTVPSGLAVTGAVLATGVAVTLYKISRSRRFDSDVWLYRAQSWISDWGLSADLWTPPDS